MWHAEKLVGSFHQRLFIRDGNGEHGYSNV
jgi:hypothetical protein